MRVQVNDEPIGIALDVPPRKAPDDSVGLGIEQPGAHVERVVVEGDLQKGLGACRLPFVGHELSEAGDGWNRAPRLIVEPPVDANGRRVMRLQRNQRTVRVLRQRHAARQQRGGHQKPAETNSHRDDSIRRRACVRFPWRWGAHAAKESPTEPTSGFSIQPVIRQQNGSVENVGAVGDVGARLHTAADVRVSDGASPARPYRGESDIEECLRQVGPGTAYGERTGGNVQHDQGGIACRKPSVKGANQEGAREQERGS